MTADKVSITTKLDPEIRDLAVKAARDPDLLGHQLNALKLNKISLSQVCQDANDSKENKQLQDPAAKAIPLQSDEERLRLEIQKVRKN